MFVVMRITIQIWEVVKHSSSICNTCDSVIF